MRPRPQSRARAGDGRFKKGVSGNPGGQPKGLVRTVRDQTKDGTELVNYMLGVLRDTKQSTAHRMDAATWLADRGWGRPGQAVQHTGGDDQPVKIVLHWGDGAA